MNPPDTPEPRSGVEPALERAVRDLIQDRRTERNWRIFFRLAWFALFVVVVGVILSRAGPSVAVSAPHTALVELRGEIAVGSEASADRLVGALREAFEDKGAVAVVLRINSPGGSPVQAGIVNDEIRRLKALHDKKVYAVVEEICASGAYYVAVAADEIFVDKASLVGSIGVLVDGFGFSEAMAKLGIERRLITAGDNKGMLDPFSPADPAQQAYVKATIEQIHQQFIEVVKQGRGDRLKPADDTFSGLFWNGEEAVRLGLVDRLGNLDYVAREVIQAADIVDYTPHDNLAERVAKRFGAAIGEGAVQALRSLPPLR
jgi:protease-4